MELEINGERKKGRPSKSWEECVKKDLERHGLRREDAYNPGNGKSKLKQKLPTPVIRDNGIKTDAVVFFYMFYCNFL